MTDLRDFRGAARPLDDLDLPRMGHRIGVGEDEIHAVLDVETAGGAWDARGRPKMLFEPHRFWRNLGPGEKRDRAARAGLAYPQWGEKPYPKDSYARLSEAMAIDETAALLSASWGLGQVLGENHAMVGHDTVQAMVLALLDDAEVHLEQMVAFILAARLDDELRAHNWLGFARGYNGAAQAKHGYAEKLRKAFERWSRIKDTPWSPDVAASIPPTTTRAIVVPVPPEVPDTAPAPIGHNGGPPLEPVPTPVQQSAKAVAAGGYAALVGTLWTAVSGFVVATPQIPEPWRDPTLLAALGTLLATVATAIGTYRAPANAPARQGAAS